MTDKDIDEVENFDGNAALPLIKAMWLNLAQNAVAWVEGYMEEGEFRQAAETAKIAEAAFWQAAGDCESHCFPVRIVETAPTEGTTHD